MTGDKRDRHEKCAACGLIIGGGTAGCRALFDRLVLPAPGDNRWLPWRRLIVDTYALQHPDPFCVSAPSLAAHLTGLAWIIDHPGDAAAGCDKLRRWLNGKPQLVKPLLPASFGDVRIDALAGARSPAESAAAVGQWSASTWQAYAPLHRIAREWIAQALAYRGRAR